MLSNLLYTDRLNAKIVELKTIKYTCIARKYQDVISSLSYHPFAVLGIQQLFPIQ